MLLSSSKLLATILAAGWLAEALAGKNRDIEAGIAAYEAGDHEAALSSYAAAEAELKYYAEDERREFPEIAYDRGLALLAKGDKEAAREAFQRGTESTHPQVHASAEYELGNLDLDAEAFDGAVEHYIKCLKTQPDHANAKWNLELALLKKKQKEEEEKKKKEQEEQDKKDQEDNKDQDQNKDDKNENEDQQKQDENKDDKDKQDQQDKPQDDKPDENKPDEPKPDEPKPDENKDDKQPEPKPEENKQDDASKQPQPQPQPLDKADLDKALEQLDAEDKFQLGRVGRPVQVEKDW